ncbi:unnamed protein product [Acanthoscelides obtectus]|uniref:Uncharacterized protein n=1 Tax=Acanthoscelides obtectus TaxID=200917 RepID=A0A9P0LBX7_ACAOB|nr:unnamed protein product [Acanthoscelides obtectus]CAK1633057.1 hypothetical protein AOBTE_LOCUS7912 [Acanthoscelides obtectus]
MISLLAASTPELGLPVASNTFPLLFLSHSETTRNVNACQGTEDWSKRKK